MLSKQKISEFYSPNEKSLIVVNQNYQLIDEDAFDGLTDVEILNFSSNQLQKLNSNLFVHLPNLKKLILSFNSINSLPAKIFSSLTVLEQLEMTNCNISSIDSTSLNGLTNLKRIILAYNDLAFIQPNTFSDLIQLEVAVFSFNKLETIHPDTFTNQKNLKRLNLKANNLKSIEKTLFINLTNLEQVILSANSLSSIDDIFTNSSNLQRLIMHSNKIAQLTKFSFKGLDKIFSIDIANNLIEKICDEVFCEMPTLKYLDMSRNCLKSINKRVFNGLTGLDELILSKNLIETLDQDLFEKNVNLKLLRLDFNQITYLKPDILANLDGLLEISCNTIDVNNMKELQEKIVNFNKKSFILNIEFINSFEDLNLILNSYEALEILQRLSLFTNRHKVELFSTIQPKVLETLTKTLIKIIEDIYQDLSSHINNFKPFVQNAKCFRIRFLSYIISIFKNWSKTLKLFCQYFDDFSGLEIVLKYLNCDDLKKNILLKKDSDSKYSYMILVDIYGDLLNLVYNSILNDQKLKKKFSDYNCFDSLIETAETLNNVSDLNFKTYLIISEIIDDELNLKRLKNIKQVTEYLVTNIKTCVNKLNENGQNVDRCPLVADENKHQNVFIDNVLILEVNNNFYYLTDFLNVLYNFAINDEIKFDIYQTYSMKCMIKILVQKGNKYEKEMSLKLLCQLCFDKRVLKDAESDRDIFLSIKILSKQKPSSETENLIKNAKSIIWLMQKNSISYEDPRIDYGLLDMRFRGMDKNMIDKNYSNEKFENSNQSKDNQNQIMISYNSKSRPICLNIKKGLEKNGYKVWIDVESIYGSSLEAMANAIESSFCVLICITENYKESNFCRLEAEYCVQKNRPFIPLILQKGYRPNGWLGIILGTKIFIDFSKYDFEKALFEVNRNLSLIKSSLNKEEIETVKSDQTESNKSVPAQNKESIESDWNENQVEDWLRRVEIDQNIINDLIPCNGQILYQLYMILKWNPEFYYHSLKTPTLGSLTNLKNLAIFTNELKKLFENQ